MQICNVKIDLIDDPGYVARLDLGEDEVDGLAKSIKSIGLRQPITVKESGGGRYEVVAGHRRLMACRRLGMDEVPCVVISEDDLDPDVVKAAENLARKDLTPVEEARMYVELHEKRGWSVRELSQMVGKTPAHVRRIMNIVRYPKVLQDALHSGQISAGAAEYLSRIDDEEALRYYLEYAIESGCTVRVAREWVSEYKKSKSAGRDVIEGGEPPGTFGNPLPSYSTCQLCGGPEDVGAMTYIAACRECIKKMKGVLVG